MNVQSMWYRDVLTLNIKEVIWEQPTKKMTFVRVEYPTVVLETYLSMRPFTEKVV